MSLSRGLLILCTTVLLCSCTSRYQKRGIADPLPPIAVADLPGETRDARIQQIDMEGRSIEAFNEITIGIVEFDDDGNLNPAQSRMVLEEVKASMARHDTLLVNFIHGWHHGARVCDRDLACFRRVLKELADANSSRKVFGVFIGWRGASCSVGKLNMTTIWNRKHAAEHIGRSGAKELLVSLQQIYGEAREKRPNTLMVSVGHSLGGAMLYSAVKGQLTGNVEDIEQPGGIGSYRIVRAVEDRSVARAAKRKALRAGFGDLVVLVNPALEAREYAPFDADIPRDDRRRLSHEELISKRLPYDANDRYSDDQLPVMITIASEADTAVGRVFPFAQWVSALPFKPYQLTPAGWHGMGRYKPHVTHKLSFSRVDPKQSSEPTSKSCDCTKSYEGLAEQLAAEARMDRESRLDLRTRHAQTIGGMKYELAEGREDWDVNSPYIVIQASRGVIREHSDIFNPQFVGFLARFIASLEEERRGAATQKR